MKDLTDRVAKLLSAGADIFDIYAMLKDEGMSDENAFFTYQGGKLIYQFRLNGRDPKVMNAPTIRNMKKVVVK